MHYCVSDVLKTNIVTLEELSQHLRMDDEERGRLERIMKRHPMSITRYYLSLIDPDNPNDPLRKIVVPSVEEETVTGTLDTSGEKESTKAVGLQHKYGQTALVLTTHRCPAYCRYCFRRRLVGLTEREIVRNIDDSVAYVREHEEITNVLLSGGDPLSLETHIIEHYLRSFLDIPHLRYIRIGSRIPVVLPERIYGDAALMSLFKSYSKADKRVHVVTHFNHPNELTPQSERAVDALLSAGVPMHNQSVLLAGINDDPAILTELFVRLTGIGVIPYYLFQCRPVKRVTHFQVPLVRGIDIVREVERSLDGISKRFRYIMSHWEGKVEVLTYDEKYLYFKYHQARDPAKVGTFFKEPIRKKAVWLDDLRKKSRKKELTS
ncbi:MAG: KamA family radical SAM protein [Candidatus Methanofastidiosa archaeon]|nr:KamA family radical SAM protein [Candidatus Methanofastidiosa archaeon]